MKHRILVVDDEIAITETLTAILTLVGYECRAATDGMHALTVAREFEPHIMISDVAMPNMDGFELNRQIRDLPHPPQVLLFSGNAAVSGSLALERSRGNSVSFLSKPVAPEILLKTVESIASRLPS